MKNRGPAALALPVCLLIGLTAAQLTHSSDVTVEFDPVTFALESAGSAEPGWQPADGDWQSGDRPVTVDLAEDTPAPGRPVEVRVAVRNTAGVPAEVVLSLVDPDPVPGDLFQALEAEVVEDDGTVIAAGPAAGLRLPLAGELAPDRQEARVLVVRIHLPVTGDDRWAGARTGVQVVFDGMSR